MSDVDITNLILAEKNLLEKWLKKLIERNPWDFPADCAWESCAYCQCALTENNLKELTYGHWHDCLWVTVMTHFNFPLGNHAVVMSKYR